RQVVAVAAVEEGVLRDVDLLDLQSQLLPQLLQDRAGLDAQRGVLLDEQLDLHAVVGPSSLAFRGILRQIHGETKMRPCWRCRAASPSWAVRNSFASSPRRRPPARSSRDGAPTRNDWGSSRAA